MKLETKAQLTAAWRKYGFGRLYWRRAHWRWRQWDSDDIAMVKDGTVSMHIKSMAALRELVETVVKQGGQRGR